MCSQWVSFCFDLKCIMLGGVLVENIFRKKKKKYIYIYIFAYLVAFLKIF